MSPKTWLEKKIESFEDDFEYRLEGLILELTAQIAERMEEKGINRKELASTLQVSPPFITKILNGTSNFTLKTVLSLADALECTLNVNLKPKEISVTANTHWSAWVNATLAAGEIIDPYGTYGIPTAKKKTHTEVTSGSIGPAQYETAA